MVSDESSREEHITQASEVDHDINPTVLHKLIESKHWNAVVARVQQQPSEAGTWISRHGKDGRKRWRILPLHACICLQAPKEVLLQILNTFPESASSADDQGMLPIHLALRNDEVDNTFLRKMLNTYPKGIEIRDKKERLPLEMKGKAIFDCWKLALDMERKKIRGEEKKQYESKLISERELLEKEIVKLQHETETSSEPKEKEMTPAINEVESSNHLEFQNINREQKEMIGVQVKELATQGELIKKLRTQIDVQEEHLRRIKNVEKTRGAEYVKLKESTQIQKKDMNSQMEKVKEQEAILQSREKEIDEKSAYHGRLKAELIDCKEISDKLLGEASTRDQGLEAEKDLILEVKEDLKSQKIETKKYKDTCEVIKAQVQTYERKVKNLTVLNANYRKSLDEMTVVVNDSVLAMQRMTLDRSSLAKNFFDKDAARNKINSP